MSGTAPDSTSKSHDRQRADRRLHERPLGGHADNRSGRVLPPLHHRDRDGAAAGQRRKRGAGDPTDHGAAGRVSLEDLRARDGQPVILAAQADGCSITTIEGLADGETLHPMQEAFREHHGLQCGYCTPGMVMAAVSLAQEGGALTEPEVRIGLEGNLCRCTGYHNIVKAVIAGSEAMAAGSRT